MRNIQINKNKYKICKTSMAIQLEEWFQMMETVIIEVYELT